MSDPIPLYAFRRNLVLAASAGTGKTHALVGVLVHLLVGASELGNRGLLPPVDPARVVATTFSRKAAAEIRARTALELERLANGDPGAKYRADLDQALIRAGRAPWSDREKAARARRALEGLGRAQIGTLHSFAGSIVRRFSLELGLSPAFELEDEDVSRERTRAVVERVVADRADHGDPGTMALARTCGGPEQLIVLLEKLTARLAEDGRGAGALVVGQGDAAIFEQRMNEVIARTRDCVSDQKLGERAARVIRAWEDADQAGVSLSLAELFELSKSASRAPAAQALFECRDALPKASSDDNGTRARKLVAGFYARHQFAEQAAAGKSLLVECERALAEESLRAQALGFGDILKAAHAVLRDRPAAAEAIGAELDCLLVDEFQDTSRIQRDLVALVWEKNPGARQPGTLATIAGVRGEGLLVVGDRKQSIYAFRGADVGIFAELAVGLAGAPAREALGVPAGATWEPSEPLADFLPLRENRRSSGPILAFANAFSRERFRPDTPPLLYEIAYAPAIEDLVAPRDQEQKVPVQIAQAHASLRSQGPKVTWLRVHAERAASTRLDDAFAIAARVRRVLDEGAPMVRGARPQYRDLAVLAHTNTMLDACAYAFSQAQIPFVVAGSGFYSAREVSDLLAMLTAILYPGDTLALLEVLRGPWVGVSDETVLALTSPGRGLEDVGAWGEGPRWDVVAEHDVLPLQHAKRTLLRLRQHADRLSPAALLREAILAFDLEEVLIQLPRGVQRVANVRKLVKLAGRETSARAFLERSTDAAAREATETEAATFSDEDDAVRLLTVHASKGLDFPIVFVPEVGTTPRPVESLALVVESRQGDEGPLLSARISDQDQLRLDSPGAIHAADDQRRRERAERARLAYVAVTRASHAMYMVGDRKPPKEESDAYANTTARSLAALPPSVLTVEEVKDPPLGPPPPSVGGAPPEPPRALVPTWRTLGITARALQDFAHCPRRFYLVHLVAMPEPTAPAPDVSSEPSEPPAMRESAYQVELREGDARIQKDLPFALSLTDPQSRSLTLRGAFDTVVRWPSGAVDALLSRDAPASSPQPYALELEVVGRAARELAGPDAHVRAGVIPSAGEIPAEPVFATTDPGRPAAQARLFAIADLLVAARWSNAYPRVPATRCRSIGCRYLSLCHPEDQREN